MLSSLNMAYLLVRLDAASALVIGKDDDCKVEVAAPLPFPCQSSIQPSYTPHSWCFFPCFSREIQGNFPVLKTPNREFFPGFQTIIGRKIVG